MPVLLVEGSSITDAVETEAVKKTVATTTDKVQRIFRFLNYPEEKFTKKKVLTQNAIVNIDQRRFNGENI